MTPLTFLRIKFFVCQYFIRLLKIQTLLDSGHLITFARYIKQLKLGAEVIRMIQGVFN